MTDGRIFRGQEAALQIDGVTVGALQDAEIEVDFEFDELEGQSIKVLDRQISRVTVNVSATYGSFDMEAVKSLIKWDDENNEIEDSPEAPEFDVVGEFKDTEGNVHDVEVSDVFFNSISLDWARDQHVEKGLSGEGVDINRIEEQTE